MERNQNCWYKDVCPLECSRTCIKYAEMKYLMDSSGIPPAQQHPIPLYASNDNHAQFRELRDIKEDIVNWVSNGNNLYICSKEAGTAKTSWAFKLMMKYFDQIWYGNGFNTRGLFVFVPELLQQLKDFRNPVSNEYKELLKTCDLVIWDDITSDISHYDYNQLLIIINNRLLNQKSNIYTSNITTKEELIDTMGGRLASRIYNTAKIIEFYGHDGRGGKQW